MPEYEFGQRVTVQKSLVRTRLPHGRKMWLTTGPGGEGLVIGKRTLSDGVVRWESDDDLFAAANAGYYVWDAERYFTVYLVVYGMRSKPVHVLPEYLAAA